MSKGAAKVTGTVRTRPKRTKKTKTKKLGPRSKRIKKSER